MKCPRTGDDLKEIEVGGVKVDISESCGGVWFDNFELVKFDEVHESAGAELVELMAKYKNTDIDLEPRLNSPKHPEVVMMRQYYSPAQRIEIDICPKSGGVWLDPGELAYLRLLYPTEADREAATNKFFEEIMPAFQKDIDTEEKRLTEKEGGRILKMLRWLFD